MEAMDRRAFVKTAAAAAGTMALAAGAQEPDKAPPLRKALQINMLPKDMADTDKLRLARACGYEGIEAHPMEDLNAAAWFGESAREAGVPVHSITYGGWQAPLSSPDPAVIKAGQEAVAHALRCTRAMGGDVLLLVPAVVSAEVRYADAYERSQKHIRELIPVAEETQVVIAVENVWNNFLLSPVEFARYIDEFESPWVKAYFDIGNVVAFGWPQDWIRTLGDRIARVHLKDFKREGREWTALGEGDVNWPEVRKALVDEVGYTGWVTPELPEGDEAYLTEMAQTINRLIIEPSWG
jgi:L-ribulose-5-phosphate 3-epimerase